MPFAVFWKATPTSKEWHQVKVLHRRKTIAKKSAQSMRNKYPGRYVRVREVKVKTRRKRR